MKYQNELIEIAEVFLKLQLPVVFTGGANK